MTDVISGLWVAMATPLDAAGGIDQAGLVRHGKWLLAQGCDGLVPFGTTGEGPAFGAAEKRDALEAMLRAGIPAGRIAPGTGCPAISDTVAQTKDALALGLSHVLVLPPYYFRNVTEQGLEDAFAAVIDGVGSDKLRATLYHIPQVSGVPVPAAALGRLRQRYGKLVAGVKDSSGDFASFRAFRAAAPDCATLVGSEVLINRALAEGGAGTICGMANLVPGLVRRMFSDARAESDMAAAVAHFASSEFLPLTKSALAASFGDDGWHRVRPPLRAVDPARGVTIARTIGTLAAQQAA
jgi:4-hydroxy-tetrahydrodipicolinate synthase